MSGYRNRLHDKLLEAVTSVAPVTVIVLLLTFTVAPIPSGMLPSFLFGALLLVVGMALFTLGSETAMTPMGEYVGQSMTKSRSLLLVIVVSFLVGLMVTISEPDLAVLANQIPSIPNPVLILSVGVGVGAFLVIAMLRILFAVRLRILLIGFYVLVFTLSFFISPEFLAVSFDSGGVTTGPMTVPFIMALGVGVASIRSDSKAEGDSFGLVSLCSVGPILSVMILGLVYGAGESAYETEVFQIAEDSRSLFGSFLVMLPHYMKEVALAVSPIYLFFLLYQRIFAPMKRGPLVTVSVGVLYTYVGLVLFLTGVNVGFMPVGTYIGNVIGSTSYAWLAIPVGMLIGYFIVSAEPAVHVLTKQVEEITSGAIPRKALFTTLGIGVAISVGLSMLRALTGISIYCMILPGYLVALILTFFVPDIFVSIAFDSGGVASGPMTATFLLPFTIGICEAVGGSVVEDAFGVVAMVAMTPLIAIEVLGLVYKFRLKKNPPETSEEDIIEM
ncbi:MAG: DUF1538 domain-containing protein [Eubacteriales bacterium]